MINIQSIKSLTLFFLLFFYSISSLASIDGRITQNLSGSGWYLWQDKDAQWQDEPIFLSFDEAKNSPHYPLNWNILTSSEAIQINVPGSAEEYLQTISGVEGDIKGVTWWTRLIDIPKYHGDKKVVLHFGSIRSRAEIFINQQFVGYQIVDNVPFQMDITPFVKPEETSELAVRLTDAG